MSNNKTKQGFLQRLLKRLFPQAAVSAFDRFAYWFAPETEWYSRSGPVITPDNSVQIAAVFACVNAISQDIAKVPFHIYRKIEQKRTSETAHPVYKILQYQANPLMDAMSFRETMTAHALLWGNGYAEIVRDSFGRPAELWPLRPDRVIPRIDENRKLIYEIYTSTGGVVRLDKEDVFSIHGLSFNGLTGESVIRYAKESLGAAVAMERMASALFSNHCQFGGILKHPGNLSQEAQNRLIQQIEKRHQGADKAYRILIVEEGMSFEKNTIPPEEAQFLESRQFSVNEICRWFRVPPHKIADLSRATFSNIEQQAIEYVVDCLLAWFRRWEIAVWNKLLTEEEKAEGYYAEHILEGLLRGDTASRYDAYRTAIANGFMTINEVRQRENLNPVEGGDRIFVPLNMVPLDDLTEADNLRERMSEDIAQRIASAELAEVERHLNAAKEEDPQALQQFKNWAETFYAKFCRYIERCLAIDKSFQRHPAESFTLLNRIRQAESINALKMDFQTWKQNRIQEMKDRLQKREIGNAV